MNTVIRVKGENRAERKAWRLSRDIKIKGYVETLKKEKKERFYINQNTGIIQ